MGQKCLRAAEEFPYDEFGEIQQHGKNYAFAVPHSKGSTGHHALSAGGAFPATPRGGPRILEGNRRSPSTESHSPMPSRSPGIGFNESPSVSHDGQEAPIQPKQSPQAIWWSQVPQVPVPVMLHIYNIGTSGLGQTLNRLLRPMGTGMFHCGVEIYNCEWSYSDTTTGMGDGVFCSRPRSCEGHSYYESLNMGRTGTSEQEVLRLIQLLKKEWPVETYDTLSHNCCHFSNELCQRLGVGSIPPWVMNLAGAGAAIAATGDTTCCRQVAMQVGDTMCCHGRRPDGTWAESVEVVDVVDQLPVLSSPRNREAASAKQKVLGRELTF